MKDFMDAPLREFRMVCVYFKHTAPDNFSLCAEPDKHIVHTSQLDRFIKAIKELHYIPGINPVNKNRTAVVYDIQVGCFKQDGPFWWSTPGLEANDDPNGALIFNDCTNSIWRHPEYQARLDREEDAMYRTEAEG